jgi:hypothetical protein
MARAAVCAIEHSSGRQSREGGQILDLRRLRASVGASSLSGVPLDHADRRAGILDLRIVAEAR